MDDVVRTDFPPARPPTGTGETVFHAASAPPLAMMQELSRRLAESVPWTIKGRRRGAIPRRVVQRFAPDKR
jgi:hypothetical protein